jgi:hypothetical protein
MLTRLLRKDDLQVAPKPLPPTLVAIRGRNQSPKRRPKPVRVSRLYPRPKPERYIHAKALLGFIQEHSPEVIGTYVPVEDLNKFYREDVCGLHKWEPRHWTGIARHLGHITNKTMVRQNGQRLIAYEIPAPF